jgi:hypothetical protein
MNSLKGLKKELLILTTAVMIFFQAVQGQKLVDKIVATVSDGTRTELITLSDLKWQIALQPGTPLDPPRKEDLQAALQRQINQRIFALEAARLPRNAPTDKEIADRIKELVGYFPSAAEFEKRLRMVGFETVNDDNFENLIAQRLAIEKYIDFRFRSFVVITLEDEEEYYKNVFLPDFRRKYPGAIVPEFNAVKQEIENRITEERVEKQIIDFLDEAKRRVQIVIISEP